jgi:hypothetical protein
MPVAHQWTDAARAVIDRLVTTPAVGTADATLLIGYREGDTTSVASAQGLVEPRQVVPDDVELLGQDGTITVRAHSATGPGEVTAADNVADAVMEDAEAVRSLTISDRGRGGRLAALGPDPGQLRHPPDRPPPCRNRRSRPPTGSTSS